MRAYRFHPLIAPSSIALFAAALPVASSIAQVPTYSQFELQARANLCVNQQEGTFNIPCNTFFANGTPVLNDNGQFVIKLDVMAGTESQGVWMGAAGKGGIVYTSPNGSNVSDPWVNNAGYAAFPQTFSSLNGVYYYDSVTGQSGFLTNQPLNTNSWASVQVNDDGVVGYRANGINGQMLCTWSSDTGVAIHAAEASLDPQSPIAYIFSPSLNNKRQIAAKVRLGGPGQTGESQPDQICLFNSDGSYVVLASDQDSDPSSPISRIDNSSPGITDDGRVSFAATLVGGARGVFVSDGKTLTTIATTQMPEISDIEFFATSMNENGLVVFRGKDQNGDQAIFVGDGKTLRRVIGRLDEVPTDNGPGQIAQHDSSPVFGGAPTINARGDIAFQCALTPLGNNQIEWGSGIYIAYADQPATTPGDVTGDGIVNVDDLLYVIGAWGPCPAKGACDADIAPPGGDGHVNVDDLLMVIANWG